MRDIYNNTINFGITPNMEEALKDVSVRTNFFLSNRAGYQTATIYATFFGSSVEVARVCSISNSLNTYLFARDIGYTAMSNKKIKHFIGKINVSNATRTSSGFNKTTNLKTIQIIKLKLDIDFSYSPLLTSKSILYMINNEAATSAITITLHADAYTRAMANADIVAALEAHPNVSLASA